MDVLHAPENTTEKYQNVITTVEKHHRPYRTTPVIITFCETIASEFDIHSFIKLGLRVVRFKMSHITKTDKIMLLELLDKALKWCCEKYDVSSWPVALSIDVPNACIKTGFLTNKLNKLRLKENSSIELTCDIMYWMKCDEHRICIDDPFTFPNLVPGIEITIDFGEIIMVCVKILDKKNIKCNIIRGGTMKDQEFVCIRGVKHTKPPLTKKDLEVIEFAKDFKFDIITINSVRNSSTLTRVREMFNDYKPLLISTICEQEGLDNIDDIIKESDAIVLAREFLAYEIADKFKMISIQLYVTGKCKKFGKPLYLSGNILEGACLTDKLTGCDLNDITNAVLQESGFIMRKYKDPEHLIRAMQILNNVCETVEPLTDEHQFWRMSYEYKIPINAAEAAVLSSILMANRTGAKVIVVPTVTGRTVKQVVHMTPDIFIMAITSHPFVAKQLQLYKGVIAIIYDKTGIRNWYTDMTARVKFAVEYGMKFEVLKHRSNYVVLRKSTPTSSYCDHVSAWTVMTDDELLRLKLSRIKSEICEEPVRLKVV